ncbi:MAG: hypothetical protein ABUL57_00250, partial [Chloroflexota bacterium]
MHGLGGAIARLLVMGAVMGVVLVGAVFAGLATTTAIAMGIVGAGVVGLLGVARRPAVQKLSAAEQIAAMMAPPAPAPHPRPSIARDEAVMAPETAAPVDPEANMPRWRRPSLLEARRADPTRMAPVHRMPMTFSDVSAELDLRVVRYAVVPVLDRPDEVLGLQISDLASGDEVQVITTSGAFIEVLCPDGDQGWVHRTTLGQRGGSSLPSAQKLAMPAEADDALTALL